MKELLDDLEISGAYLGFQYLGIFGPVPLVLHQKWFTNVHDMLTRFHL